MKKGTKRVLGVAAASTIGIVSWNMYKKKNPMAVEDMKRKARKLATDAAHKLEDMD